MKKQIRRAVFETNSSSCHSLTMCSKSDYDKWENGEVYLCTNSYWGYSKDNMPKENHFYTKEQVISFVESKRNAPENMDWNNDEEVKRYLHGVGWCDYDYFWNRCEYNYETFEEKYITSNGDTVIAFGYYE